MKHKDLLNFYGLKWNPFSSSTPIEGLSLNKKIESFCWRVETIILDGGYSVLVGNSGTGKSITLRFLANRLEEIKDISIGIISRPQSSISDFYRELSDIYNISFKNNNRWNSYQNLRKKWINFLNTGLLRPVLIVDEAQEMSIDVLNEIRLMSSVNLDSKIVLAVIFSGDMRLLEKFRHPQLIPLSSRIRVNQLQELATKDELEALLKEIMRKAGNATIFSNGLVKILADQSMGNYRSLMVMANTLLQEGVQREITQLTEQHYFEIFDPNQKKKPRKPKGDNNEGDNRE
jgi:type II secretory pathway predicted ATPase ExeA